MKYYTSTENGSFWRNFLDKSYNDGKMTKELYDSHIKIHEDSIISNEKSMIENNSPNLERDLRSNEKIHTKCIKSSNYCRDLYSALCNNRFFKNDKEWTCSWRYAGGIISDLIEKGDYIDWYCSGYEGNVTDEIRSDLTDLGWVIKSYDNE